MRYGWLASWLSIGRWKKGARRDLAGCLVAVDQDTLNDVDDLLLERVDVDGVARVVAEVRAPEPAGQVVEVPQAAGAVHAVSE